MKQYVDRKEILFGKKDSKLNELLKDNFFKTLVYEIAIKGKN